MTVHIVPCIMHCTVCTAVRSVLVKCDICSSGDLLRANLRDGTPLGLEAKGHMAKVT